MLQRRTPLKRTGGLKAKRAGPRTGRMKPNARFPDAKVKAYRSEEHTSELQSLMRISYAVFCLKKKKSENIYQHIKQPSLTTEMKHATRSHLFTHNINTICTHSHIRF